MPKIDPDNTYVVSDNHFFHSRSLEFVNEETGVKMRPWAPGQVEEMNEHMVRQWNSVVSPDSLVLHCGDVFFTKDGWKILDRLNGKKELIMGNHDDKAMEHYTRYFRRLHGSYTVRSRTGNHDLILTHIPVHPSQFFRFFGNVHGHIHDTLILGVDGKPDPRYLNVCVEQINYTPITLRECIRRIEENRDKAGYHEVSVGR